MSAFIHLRISIVLRSISSDQADVMETMVPARPMSLESADGENMHQPKQRKANVVGSGFGQILQFAYHSRLLTP